MGAKKSTAKAKPGSGVSVRSRALGRRLTALEKHLGIALQKVQKLRADAGDRANPMCW